MKGKYSYIDIAREDLQAGKEMLRVGMYNHAVRLCQQYVEKCFKEFLEKHSKEDTDLLMLQSHSIHRLASRCTEISSIEFSRLEKAFFRELTDYYFDTNYPGDDYIRATEADAAEIMQQTLQFQADYENKLTA